MTLVQQGQQKRRRQHHNITLKRIMHLVVLNFALVLFYFGIDQLNASPHGPNGAGPVPVAGPAQGYQGPHLPQVYQGPPPQDYKGPPPPQWRQMQSGSVPISAERPVPQTRLQESHSAHELRESSYLGKKINNIPLVRKLSGGNRNHLSQCDGIYEEIRSHGYDVIEYKIKTKDDYELKLHRIVRLKNPEIRSRKPYILLHGLLGSSTSFVRNIDPNYQAPSGTDFDRVQAISKSLVSQDGEFKTSWRSTADQLRQSYSEDNSQSIDSMSTYQKLLTTVRKPREKQFSTIEELDYDADTMTFAPKFRQAYRKYELPKKAKELITNSLAYTLVNFGYDVWLINLRGSHFSRGYNGRLSAKDAEYWKFGVEQLINEDILASVNYVKNVAKWSNSIGFISYSYSSLYVLGLLTKHPEYQQILQPIVLMAPAILTNTWHNIQMSLSIKLVTKALAPYNGPFPALGRSKSENVEHMLCARLPIAKKLCTTPEILLHGRAKGVKDFMFDDKEGTMITQDIKCGQTSAAVLRKIVKGLDDSLSPEFKPFIKTRNKILHKSPVRRTIMLIHSEDDEISNMAVAEQIKNSACKMLVLSDIVIKEPRFAHTEFLFGKRNQYLVNGEIVRWVSVFDFMLGIKSANEVIEREIKSVY